MSSWIAEIVRSEGGRVSFDRFMELALYHPSHGYYTGHIKTVGRSGDFSTALTIGDALVRSVAAWVKAEANLLALPVAQIIELGGGAGQLASGVLRTFVLGNASGIRSSRFPGRFGRFRSESFGERISGGKIPLKRLSRRLKVRRF